MTANSLAAVLSITALLATGTPLRAQDIVTLHSVTIDANADVTVVYSKNFATCAHLRFGNATCTLYGPLTHTQNLFCAQGSMVSVTRPLTAFVAGFGPGIDVFMVHGNNAGVRSACVTVACNGVYGVGCAGAAGVPALSAANACPSAPGTLDLTVTNALPLGIGVLGFGAVQANLPVLGCDLLIGGITLTSVVLTDTGGTGISALPLPPASAGLEFAVQCFLLDGAGPQGFAATNGIAVQVL